MWGLGPHVTVVGTTLRYELTRVTIVLVPSLLRRVERSRVGIALGFEVVNGVDSGATSTNANHRSVLVGANDGSKRIQHSFLCKGVSGEGILYHIPSYVSTLGRDFFRGF